jgi:hypothetical protein
LPELDRELRALAVTLDWPAERDFVPAVRARLTQPSTRREIPWRKVAGVVAVVLVIATAATMAVPDARTAVLRFLGLKGVTVIRVEQLPPAPPPSEAFFGDQVSLAEAERIAGIDLLLPDLGPPDQVWVDRLSPNFVVIHYGRPNTRLRLTELVGGFVEKYATAEQRVERVQVNGGPGIWIEGEHVVSGPAGPPRRAASALLWEQEGLTVRMEGDLSKERALEIARTVR